MKKTVSQSGSVTCYSVQPESIWQLLRWVHFDMADPDFANLLADVAPRLATPDAMLPLELVDGRSRVAAAYFVPLAGSVATLGGMRVRTGHEASAGVLLGEYLRQLKQSSVAQVQALVDVRDLSTKMAMLHSPFRQVTTIRHLLFDLQFNLCPAVALEETYQVAPAHHFPQADVIRLVEQSFVGTLDCPELDGTRSAAEVVTGFLESQRWDESLPWLVLCQRDMPIGCAFINQHPRSIFELAYIGLVKAFRGRGLGKALVVAAMEACRQRGGHYLTTAVDTQNWPACKIYSDLQFSELRELGVWLPKRSKASRLLLRLDRRDSCNLYPSKCYRTHRTARCVGCCAAWSWTTLTVVRAGRVG